MTPKTESEVLFETFCAAHSLEWAPHGTASSPTPDYRLGFGGTVVCFEIKQIETDAGLSDGTGTRTVGERIRGKISEAKDQLQAASHAGLPAVLLVYNKIDPCQTFGTEQHDFICAMYGEWTVRLTKGRITDSFHGRNSSLRHNANTSFSAVGHLRRTESGAAVVLFENAYARHPLPFAKVPECFDMIRVEVENAA